MPYTGDYKSSIRKGKFVPVFNYLNNSSLRLDDVWWSADIAQDRGD
jgi:hypothetical protein